MPAANTGYCPSLARNTEFSKNNNKNNNNSNNNIPTSVRQIAEMNGSKSTQSKYASISDQLRKPRTLSGWSPVLGLRQLTNGNGPLHQ